MEAYSNQYPGAFEIYRAHCKSLLSKRKYATLSSIEDPDDPPAGRRVRLPEGTALIIPPQERDYLPQQSRGTKREQQNSSVQCGSKKRHWIVCLFTSRRVGRNVSPPEVILANTRTAVEDMKRQLMELKNHREDAYSNGIHDTVEISDSLVEKPGELWSCKFNSGLFGVDWKLSRKILEDASLNVTVITPKEE